MNAKQIISLLTWILVVGFSVVFTILSIWWLFGGEGIRLLHAAETPYDIGNIATNNIASAVWLLGVGYGLFGVLREMISHAGEQASEVENAE